MSDETNLGAFLPDIYFDRAFLTTSVFGVTIVLGRSDVSGTATQKEETPEAEEPNRSQSLAIVRTSLEHAKVLCMLLAKHIKDYENKNDVKVQLPKSLYEEFGINEKDW